MFDYNLGLLNYAVTNSHRYYLSSTGTGLKDKVYETRKAAELAMHQFCVAHNISVECTEYDKHERKYSNHKGVRFYINRI